MTGVARPNSFCCGAQAQVAAQLDEGGPVPAGVTAGRCHGGPVSCSFLLGSAPHSLSGRRVRPARIVTVIVVRIQGRKPGRGTGAR